MSRSFVPSSGSGGDGGGGGRIVCRAPLSHKHKETPPIEFAFRQKKRGEKLERKKRKEKKL